MKAELRTAGSQYFSLVFRCVLWRHPAELNGIEGRSVMAVRADVDPDRTFGFVEPRIANGDKELLRRSTNDEEERTVLDRIENQSFDVPDATILQIEHGDSTDRPAPPELQVLDRSEHQTT